MSEKFVRDNSVVKTGSAGHLRATQRQETGKTVCKFTPSAERTSQVFWVSNSLRKLVVLKFINQRWCFMIVP